MAEPDKTKVPIVEKAAPPTVPESAAQPTPPPAPQVEVVLVVPKKAEDTLKEAAKVTVVKPEPNIQVPIASPLVKERPLPPTPLTPAKEPVKVDPPKPVVKVEATALKVPEVKEQRPVETKVEIPLPPVVKTEVGKDNKTLAVLPLPEPPKENKVPEAVVAKQADVKKQEAVKKPEAKPIETVQSTVKQDISGDSAFNQARRQFGAELINNDAEAVLRINKEMAGPPVEQPAQQTTETNKITAESFLPPPAPAKPVTEPAKPPAEPPVAPPPAPAPLPPPAPPVAIPVTLSPAPVADKVPVLPPPVGRPASAQPIPVAAPSTVVDKPVPEIPVAPPSPTVPPPVVPLRVPPTPAVEIPEAKQEDVKTALTPEKIDPVVTVKVVAATERPIESPKPSVAVKPREKPTELPQARKEQVTTVAPSTPVQIPAQAPLPKSVQVALLISDKSKPAAAQTPVVQPEKPVDRTRQTVAAIPPAPVSTQVALSQPAKRSPDTTPTAAQPVTTQLVKRSDDVASAKVAVNIPAQTPVVQPEKPVDRIRQTVPQSVKRSDDVASARVAVTMKNLQASTAHVKSPEDGLAAKVEQLSNQIKTIQQALSELDINVTTAPKSGVGTYA